jgi:type II secretory pathway pseudopilin PulG
MERAMKIGNYSRFYIKASLGFTYIGLLILIAISGIALAGVGIVWHQDVQREREKELLFIGEEYRKAIGSYYENTPSQVKQFPKKIEDLLLDNRFPNIKRHIRKLYKNPVTFGKDWDLELQQGKIIGVYSPSELAPIKKVGFMPQYATFGDAQKYNEWKFIYAPGSLPVSAPQSEVATQ